MIWAEMVMVAAEVILAVYLARETGLFTKAYRRQLYRPRSGTRRMRISQREYRSPTRPNIHSAATSCRDGTSL